MGIMDSLKGMVGSGSPKVEVKLLKNQAAVQEEVKGIATFTGGEYPVKIDSIVFYMLMEEEVNKKISESTDKLCSISFNDYSLESKEVISVPFQIVVPKNNLISSTAIKHFVQVKLDINGQDSYGVSEIKII